MKNNSKKLWSYIKHKKQDSSGVAPLEDTDGILYSDTPAKAEILIMLPYLPLSNRRVYYLYIMTVGI
jgi:hypothetical protein